MLPTSIRRATAPKAQRQRKRAYPWYEGIPLCRECWVQHVGPCPVFDMHIGPCPCSFGRASVPDADTTSSLRCPPGPHERYQVAKSMGALAELLRAAMDPAIAATTGTP